ncbi:hypothetical protein KP509_17G036800 [Ceratopteris richardii]|uniref:Reverse transcriptase zinc-binding domain-containing protein n=1 Tax=Ceratopteris richardii TaxID=49495 RepID=A0A8T2SXH8_CERRI|nr:hypothetical protein KP509_17G036800 [Ceratopteris richardii]
MGFQISFAQRWEWVVERFKKHLLYWYDANSSLPHRTFVLNHYILPKLVYFLACWSPSNKQLEQVICLARNFLWGSKSDQKKVPKVAWKICCLPKFQGGLGIINPVKMAENLAAKWILRCIDCNDVWACLLKRNISRFYLSDYRAWKNINLWDIIISPHPVTPVGSPLVCRMWLAWFKAKNSFKLPNDFSGSLHFFLQESPWLGWLAYYKGNSLSIKQHKCHKAGISSWNNFMSGGLVRNAQDVLSGTNLSLSCLQVV